MIVPFKVNASVAYWISLKINPALSHRVRLLLFVRLRWNGSAIFTKVEKFEQRASIKWKPFWKFLANILKIGHRDPSDARVLKRGQDKESSGWTITSKTPENAERKLSSHLWSQSPNSPSSLPHEWHQRVFQRGHSPGTFR